MRTLIIKGQDFETIEGFYKNLEPCLIEGDCPWGQNLNSLDEIVMCDFNYSENEDNNVNKIIWTDFQKSKKELSERLGDKTVIEIIDEIFSGNTSIEFIKK